MKKLRVRPRLASAAPATLVVVMAALHAAALPVITNIVEINGDNEATDTIPAKWTGITFNRTVANEPSAGAVGTAFTVPVFGEEVPAFVDRNHQWTAATPTVPLPRYLVGGEYIMSGNDNRDNIDYQLEVSISEKSFVYMLIDDRLGNDSNANPPNYPDWALDANGDGLPDMGWIIDDGWQPVRTGQNRHGNPAWPDHIGMDESADGTGPGQGVNQWASIYTKTFDAGTFVLKSPDNGGRNMYGAVVVPYPKKPIITDSRGDLLGFSFSILDGSQTQVNPATISVTLDGNPVTVQTTKSGDVTTISYSANPQFASQSAHTVVLQFSDNGTPGPATPFTETLNFTAEYYATLTSALTAPSGEADLASPGLTARIAQAKDNVSWPSFDLPQNVQRAEAQLAGRLLDPATGQPFANAAAAGPHVVTNVNWNQELNEGGNAAEIGSFTSVITPDYPDVAIPGIGAIDSETGANNRDNIAGEIVGYVQLPVGLHRLGVNSDDGFRATVSRSLRDGTGVLLGEFNGGRGAADSLFYVDVKDAGLYPIRVIWFEGGGGANLEIFSVAGTNKYLINGAEAAAFKSYSRAGLGASTAPAVSVSPIPGQNNIAGSTEIVAVLTDGTTPVSQASVQLQLDGTNFAAQVTQAGGVTTVRLDPPGFLAPGAHTATLSYSAGAAGSLTNTWSFTVQNWTAFPIIPAGYAVPAGSVNLADEGFLADVYQIPVNRNDNNVAAAERQIARGYLDPATGLPYDNMAFPGPEADGRHVVSVINWNETAPANAGGFNAGNNFPDSEIPGLFSGDQNNIVAEMITYLELKAGMYRLGVNCDDGFKLTTAPDPRSQLPTLLALRSPGGGSTDVLFNFIVEQDGIYPMRLLWWEGTGGANVEFFVEDLNTGARALVNDRTRYFAPKAYRTYTGAARTYVKSVSPAPDATAVFGDAPIDIVLANLGGSAVALKVNEADVTPTVTPGADTRVFFQPSALFAPGSTNTVTLAYGTVTNTWSFVVANYPTLPIAQRLPLDATDTSAPGMLAKVVQAKNFTAGGVALTLDNTTARAEGQLAGTLVDPDTQQPYANEAIAGTGPDGRYVVSNFVNWGQAPGIDAEEGNFVAPNYPDQPVPGIPGSGGHTDNIAAEVVGWLELPAGLVKLGVNSDDGFRLTLGTNASPTALELGVYEGGRSDTDSLFSFVVPAAGLYPFRLIWYEGNGGASVEFFSINSTGQKVLVNDRVVATAIKSYYKVLPVAAAPVIDAPVVSGGNITVTWQNGGTLFSAPTADGPWTSTGDSDGSFTEPATAAARFYRAQR